MALLLIQITDSEFKGVKAMDRSSDESRDFSNRGHQNSHRRHLQQQRHRQERDDGNRTPESSRRQRKSILRKKAKTSAVKKQPSRQPFSVSFGGESYYDQHGLNQSFNTSSTRRSGKNRKNRSLRRYPNLVRFEIFGKFFNLAVSFVKLRYFSAVEKFEIIEVSKQNI